MQSGDEGRDTPHLEAVTSPRRLRTWSRGRCDAAMARRKGVDWRREWAIEQLEEDRERQAGPQPRPSPHRDDWRAVPTDLLSVAAAEGRVRLFVVQTCRWREDWD